MENEIEKTEKLLTDKEMYGLLSHLKYSPIYLDLSKEQKQNIKKFMSQYESKHGH
jgi:hypothetical protein